MDSKIEPTSIISPQGKLALMFLKHYGCCSDKRLIQQLNGNLEWQFFCRLYLGSVGLDNFKIVSEVRCELSKKLSIYKVQQILYNHWSAYMGDKQSLTTNVTCYENHHLRYPTNVKLLWEFVDWLYWRMKKIAGELGESLPHTKYLEWKKRDVGYSKMRRKPEAGKHEQQRRKLAGAITKDRASRLEGSFGKDKEHYHLKRIWAHTKATEILWIFFGIYTGNALEIGRRISAVRLQNSLNQLLFITFQGKIRLATKKKTKKIQIVLKKDKIVYTS